MRLSTLIKAIIKTFLRNKESIILLIVAPFILIMIIFLSFSSKGMHPVPAGVVGNTPELNITKYEDSYFSFLKITDYTDIDSCIRDIKSYKQYLCVELKDDGIKPQLSIYYDNTREPIIWQVIERIQFTIGLFQKQQSKEMTTSLLGSFGQTASQIDSFRTDISKYDDQIDLYIADLSTSQQKLKQAQLDLTITISSMDNDISQAKQTRNELKEDKENFYDDALQSSNELDMWINSFPANNSYQYTALNEMRSENNQIRNEIANYNNQADYKFMQLDSKISSYEYTSSRSKQYINSIDSEIYNLENTKKELSEYKNVLNKADGSIENMSKGFKELSNVRVDDIVTPFTVQNIPAYIPEFQIKNNDSNSTAESSAKELTEGTNLLGLQTIYPTVVFLILLFLSLLISTFITLNYINSSANTRITLLKGIILSETAALYISSLIIVLIPIACILAVGQFLFQLPIVSSAISIIIIITLVSSAFIILGMILSNIIRKESITLLMMTFLLVLFTFFSGFVLPIERMSTVAGYIAQNSPSNLGLEAFKIIVFYGNSIGAIVTHVKILLATIIILTIILLGIRYLKK